MVTDPFDHYFKKIRRQQQRQKRRQLLREIHEAQLLDLSYQGYTQEQELRDQQLKTQLEWFNKLLK